MADTEPARMGWGENGFLGSGELAGLIAAFDWSRTALGPIGQWPGFLRTVIATVLRSPVPIVTLWRPDGVMIYNDAYAVFAGGRHPLLLGSNVREGWPEVADFNDNVLRTGLAGRTLSYREQELVLLRTGKPETVWLDLDYSPVFDDEGVPAGVIAIVVEATEKVRAERWLRDETERLRRMFEQAPSFMSMKSGPEHRFELVNEAYSRLVGARARDVIGKTVREAVPELAGQGLVELLDLAFRSGVTQQGLAHPVKLRRVAGGELEQRYIDFVYQPVRDEQGEVVGIFAQGSDVTARVMAERAARETQANFEAVTRVIPVHVFTAGPDGVADWINDWGAAYLGEPPERAIGERWGDFVHADDVPAAVERWLAAVAAGGNFEAEYRLKRADGMYRWHLARGQPIRGEDGAVVRWVGSITDIHERKLAEAHSTRDRERSWTLSPVVKGVATIEGEMRAVNPAWTKVLGWAEDETVGRNVMEFVAPEDMDAAAAGMAQLARGEAIAEFRIVFATRDGGRRVLAWNTVPEGGMIYGFGRDITAEEAAAQALRASLAERDRIWNSTNDLMGTAGLDGYLRQVNPAWSRLLGYADAELLAMPYMRLIDPADVPRTEAALARLAQGQPVRDFEHRVMHQDGGRSLISWTAEPAGEVFYIVGHDVTEQRAAEEALRQSQKMEAVGQLTGGIAHDFNNLLQGITGSLDLLAKRIAQGRMGELERFIAGAMGAANRASALTHRLLAFARRQPLDPKPVRVNPLVASMEDLLRRTMGETIELELVLGGALWMTLCDPNQLENAVLNLAINARDAMPDGGKLTIETVNSHLDDAYAAHLRDVRPGQYVCICVTDTGMGMSADTIAKAFEPFFTTKPIGQGTGLGLSMIYGFARQSEGYAKIYSELGKGTTVKLYLPRYRGEAEAETEPAERRLAVAHADGETVLVVEDEPVVRGLIVEVLNDLGYAALEAADGPQGLEMLRGKRRIDLLITDIGLPGLNGRQVADAGRVLRPGLKVLFMTGYAENAAFASGFLEPGMAMITKPFAMEALAGRIRGIIEAG